MNSCNRSVVKQSNILFAAILQSPVRMVDEMTVPARGGTYLVNRGKKKGGMVRQ